MPSPTDPAPAPRAETPARSTGQWQRKHRAILDAARTLFVSDGYGRTSMDAIADRARVSKATLYKHFANKAALFEAIVDGLCNQLFEPIRQREAPLDEPRTLLQALALRYLDILLEPDSLGLHRALVADEAVCRELGARSYVAGAGAAQRELAAHLERWRSDGVLAIEDCGLAAEQFFGMVTGHNQIRALLGVCDGPAQAERTRLAENAVATFLRAFAPARDPAGAGPQA